MSEALDRLYARLPVLGQNLACTWAGRQRWRDRFTPHFHRTLAEWEETGRGPVERLHELQRERLFRLVEKARAHVPHYRDLEPPITAGDASESIARTLARIPILDKEGYRRDPESFLRRDLPLRELRRGKTSGTTGTALPLWYTAETVAEEYATLWRARRAAGVRLGDANLTFNGQVVVPVGETRPPFWRTNWYGRQTIFSLYHMSPDNLRHYVDGVHATPATYVQGYPSSIHLMARALLDAGRPLPPGRLRAVFTSSESLLAFQREAIERAFQAPVRDRYGVSELAVSMTECDAQRLHVDMEFGIVEVEPHEETDEYVRGPLLVTGLSQDAAPFLRYRIGDVGTRSKRPCPCGRPGDVFLDVDGRIEDYVTTPDGRLIGRLDHIFKAQLDVAEAQILQETPDAIEVRYVPRESFDAGSERQLLKEIRSRLGEAIRIDLARVEFIPREPNGKFRAVKSKCGRLDRDAGAA
jgi:phenylacetate-CoA ligase